MSRPRFPEVLRYGNPPPAGYRMCLNREGVFVALPSDDGYLRQRLLITLLLVAITAGAGVDLAMDLPQGRDAFHIAFEAALVALSLGAIAYLWIGWLSTRRSLATVREMSATYREQRDVWRNRSEKLLRGLGEEIDTQLRDWRLTHAERAAFFLEDLLLPVAEGRSGESPPGE